MILITPSEVLDYAFSAREQITPQAVKVSKIITCCEQYVRPRFGDNLYDKFTEGDYNPFVESYLKPAIAHYVRYAIVDELSIQLSDGGAIRFDQREQQSEQTRQNRLSETSQNRSVGEDRVSDLSKITSQNSLKSTTTGKEEGSMVVDKSTHDNAKTSGEVIHNNTQVIDKTTNTTDKHTKTSDTTQNTSENTELKDIKDRDYSFHESPITVGVSTIGNSHDVQSTDKKVTTNFTGNDSVIDNGEGSVRYNCNDTFTGKDATDQMVIKDGTVNSTERTTDSSSIIRDDATKIDRQDSTDRSVDTTRQTDQTAQRTTDDDHQQSTTLRQHIAATDHQRQLIRARALADANILMARAIRYVERNVELFPEYKPGRRSYGRIVF